MVQDRAPNRRVPNIMIDELMHRVEIPFRICRGFQYRQIIAKGFRDDVFDSFLAFFMGTDSHEHERV